MLGVGGLLLIDPSLRHRTLNSLILNPWAYPISKVADSASPKPKTASAALGYPIASHNVLASTQAIVDKFGHVKRPIPTDLVTLIGVSIALRGDVDNELQREAWYKFCKVSLRRQKAFESMLIRTLNPN